MKPKASQGFSLIEVALALGLFAVLGLAVVGLLGGGVEIARSIQTDYQLRILCENVFARYLLEPEFGPSASRSAVEFPSDLLGNRVDREEADFLLTLRQGGTTNWQSDYLETATVEVRGRDGSQITQFTISRARSKPTP
jgi:prepilin-type N-terminal cleavage/methylation domain-containing protein